MHHEITSEQKGTNESFTAIRQTNLKHTLLINIPWSVWGGGGGRSVDYI